MQQKEIKSTLYSQEKKNKKMSNREIYRILAFEFRQPDSQGIKLSIISEMVSNLFYPNIQQGDSKLKYKQLIEQSFKSYCNQQNEITEDKFNDAMQSVEKYINQQTTQRFLQKIFRRHIALKKKDQEKSNEPLFMSKDEFKVLMKNYKDENITDNDIKEIYDKMSQGDKRGISFENFCKYSM